MAFHLLAPEVYTRLPGPRLSSPNLPRGACWYAHGGHTAALVLTGLGRRLRARPEACGPSLIDKPNWSAGDCRGPLQNKTNIDIGSCAARPAQARIFYLWVDCGFLCIWCWSSFGPQFGHDEPTPNPHQTHIKPTPNPQYGRQYVHTKPTPNPDRAETVPRPEKKRAD